MWEKHFKIAQRQFLSGKFKTVEEHATKALQAAQETGNLVHVAFSQSLLCKLYIVRNDPMRLSKFEESISATERAFGPNSPELGDELDAYSVCLQTTESLVQAISVAERAMGIWKTLGQTERITESLIRLGAFECECGNFHRANELCVELIALQKRTYGPLSNEVLGWVPLYAKILEQLGKHDEVSQLEHLSHDCPTCDPDATNNHYSPESMGILATVQTELESGDLENSIDVLRRSLAPVNELVEKTLTEIAANDLFVELKSRNAKLPVRWVLSTLGQLLRVKGENEQNPEALSEAAECFRQCLDIFPNDSDRGHLMLTLVDLWSPETSDKAEIGELLASSQKCTATMYTKALLQFLVEGSTKNSRTAMKDAVDYNLEVLYFLGNPDFDPDLVPNHSPLGSREEAMGYVMEAHHQWMPMDRLEFLMETLNRTLPRSYKPLFDQLLKAHLPGVSQSVIAGQDLQTVSSAF